MSFLRRLRAHMLLPMVAALLALPAAAQAAAVPGATYTGTAADGAAVSLTVSSDGTKVVSYRLLGIFGKDANGQTCQDTTSVGPGGGGGASITSGSFQDSINSSFSISGTFGATQSVSGTFDLSQPAQAGGAGCSTGTVAWTATTTSKPPAGGSVGSNGTGGKKQIPVRLSLRRQHQRKLTGAVRASVMACTARRTVYLWSGHRRLRTLRADRRGGFSVAVRKTWRRERLHATVRALVTKSGSCVAVSSPTIKG